MIIDLTRDFSAEVHTSEIRLCYKLKFCYSLDCISYGFKERMVQLLRMRAVPLLDGFLRHQ